MSDCHFCGAPKHNNLTCPVCRSHNTEWDDSDRRHGEAQWPNWYPGTQLNSIYYRNIRALREWEERRRRRGLQAAARRLKENYEAKQN